MRCFKPSPADVSIFMPILPGPISRRHAGGGFRLFAPNNSMALAASCTSCEKRAEGRQRPVEDEGAPWVLQSTGTPQRRHFRRPDQLMNESIEKRLKSVLDALLAFSLVNLCFIRTRWALFFDKDFRYYKHNSLTKETLLALGLNLIVFGLIGWRLIRWVRRADSRNLYRAACVIVCALLAIPLDFLRIALFQIPAGKLMILAKSPFFIGGGMVVLFVFWRWPRITARVLAAGLMVCAPMAVLTFGKIGYYLLNPPPRIHARLPSLFPTPLPSVQPRVVWIIFDELDQRLAFSRPAEGHATSRA